MQIPEEVYKMVMELGKILKIDLKNLPEAGTKYKLGLKIGGGVGGEVFEAVDTETGRKVAIKVVDLRKDTEEEIRRECQVLKESTKNQNFPKFYEVLSKKGKDGPKIWLVMEFCEGGTATDFVRKLEEGNEKAKESHIAYIMRETIKAVIHLHESNIAHRDIRGANILLTGDGKVKLVDFGISKSVDKSKKMKTCIGSPSWLAPEVIACRSEDEPEGYDRKADVWAIGITAIELGDGQAPFEEMHPGRALFQIVQNPPPTLRKPSDWSQMYNDFISECLVKNPENRPHVQELLGHTFFEQIDADENLLSDIAAIIASKKEINLYKKPDVQIKKGYLRIENQSAPEKILQEDLASMTDVSEDSILTELYERLKKNHFQTFIGDVLLILNPNKNLDIYGEKHHKKYRFKGKSENSPHVYSIAESAYRDVFHHEKPQHVLFAGETGAGKTVSMRHVTDHLLFLGQGLKSSEKVTKALSVIHALGNASTPHNADSTRHVLRTQLTFTNTGKVSGAIFRICQLEKERVTMTSKKQGNFHLFYYFYDGTKSENKLPEFQLSENDQYAFLKTDPDKGNPQKDNIAKYREFKTNLKDLEFDEEEINSIEKIISAVILIGEIQFGDDEDGNGVLTSPEVVAKVADLLGVDKKKLSWALLNYCVIIKGQAAMRHNSKEEADEAKDVLARGIYSRLVDWIVNKINERFSVFRVIYGDKHSINLLDFYGFECYKKNSLSQLLVNTINEQFQFHFNQKMFAWEKQVAEEEGDIPFPNLDFNDNKMVVDLIMSKPDGLLSKIEEATRNDPSSDLIEGLGTSGPIFAETSREFSINHYTGKLTYDAGDMTRKNQDFLPPEIIDTMRLSTSDVTKQLFSSLLSKSGNLSTQRQRVGGDNKGDDKINTTPQGQYSQSRQMRTAVSTFRSTCVDILKTLTMKDAGFHFVRCIRTDLSNKPGGFDPEVVRQQLRALAVVNTVLTTQQSYSYSASHQEFIRRYKFLAFDFDENVEETKENCRLLLLRLKLEGWTMGKTKVFLKYYNKEYLSRLYETQIKKIVKVQSMMRAFITRRKLYAKIRRYQDDADKYKLSEKEDPVRMKESEAAAIIQKRYREHAANTKRELTETQKVFIRPWFKRWRVKTIFQVLLLYRAERLQTFVNFCLQIHIYNQNALASILKTNKDVKLEEIDLNADPLEYLPPGKLPTPRLLFTWESLNLRGDVTNCEPLPECNIELLESEIKNNLNKRNTSRKRVPETSVKGTQTSLDVEERVEDPSNIITEFEEKLKDDAPQNTTNEMEEEINKNSSNNIINQTEELNENNQNTINQKEEEPNNDKIQYSSDLDQNANFDNNLPSEETQQEDCRIDNKKIETKETRIITISSQPSTLRKRSFPTPEQRHKTSLTELQERFRNTDYDENGDAPPFNFRAILRKTTVPERILDHDSLFPSDFFSRERRESLRDKKCRHSDIISTEIAPGILIHGKITDL